MVDVGGTQETHEKYFILTSMNTFYSQLLGVCSRRIANILQINYL